MATDDAALVFPIGHSIGAFYDVQASAEPFYQVRAGPEMVRLSKERFAVWGLAHGPPDRPMDQPWNRNSVVAAAREAGVADAEPILDSLIEDFLLQETTVGTDSAVDFAQRHWMGPLMQGLGNTAAEPGLYSVGLIGQPLVTMSLVAYDLYEWAHLESNLWLGCRAAAERAVRAGVGEPVATDPVRILNALLGTLHVLLSPNAVYLDTRRAD